MIDHDAMRPGAAAKGGHHTCRVGYGQLEPLGQFFGHHGDIGPSRVHCDDLGVIGWQVPTSRDRWQPAPAVAGRGGEQPGENCGFTRSSASGKQYRPGITPALTAKVAS
jgi:hypothetical protein